MINSMYIWELVDTYGQTVFVGSLAESEAEAKRLVLKNFVDSPSHSVQARRDSFHIYTYVETSEPDFIVRPGQFFSKRMG